jgi:hypothetical protein
MPTFDAHSEALRQERPRNRDCEDQNREPGAQSPDPKARSRQPRAESLLQPWWREEYGEFLLDASQHHQRTRGG